MRGCISVTPRIGVDIEHMAVLGESVDQRPEARRVCKHRAPLLVTEVGGDRPRMMHLLSHFLRGFTWLLHEVLAAELAQSPQLGPIGDHRPLAVDPARLHQPTADPPIHRHDGHFQLASQVCKPPSVLCVSSPTFAKMTGSGGADAPPMPRNRADSMNVATRLRYMKEHAHLRA